MIAQFDPKKSHRWIWSVVILGLLGAVALTDRVRGEDQSKPDAANTPSTTRPAEPGDNNETEIELRVKLAQRIPEVKFDQLAFSDAVDFLRDTSHANFAVEWRVLEAAGIDKSAQVSVRLKNITLKQALDRILSDVGGGAVRLSHAVRDGAIVISTEEDLSRYTRTAAYDVQDLIVQNDPNQSREQTVERLMKLIQDVAVPETWKANGGSIGSISELNGKLIVQQTDEGQQKVGEILKLLKDKAQQPPVDPSGGRRGPVMGMGGREGLFPPQGPQPSAPRTVVWDESIEHANQSALVLLQKKVPEVKFDGIALSDVIDFYRDITGANIVANWKKLEEAGIDRNTPITLMLRDARFESVLQATLRQAAAQGLVMVIDRGVLTITTQLDLPGYMLTKTYETRDLVGEDAQAMSSLVSVMQNLAMTQEGGVGVQAFGTKMIVTALPNAHEQVDKLLADLRKSPTTRPAHTDAQPRVPGGF